MQPLWMLAPGVRTTLGLSVTVCSKRANIKFDELVIRSWHCKQTNRVTVFATEVRGAAVHSCVFAINTPDTIVITATWTVGDSLELQQRCVGTRAASAAFSWKIDRLVQLPQPQESQITWTNKQDLWIPSLQPNTCQTESFTDYIYSVFICTEISQVQSNRKKMTCVN